MYCAKCGTENDPASSFCPKCGTKIQATGSVADKTETALNQLTSKLKKVEKTQYRYIATFLAALQILLYLSMPLFGVDDEGFNLFQTIAGVFDGDNFALIFGTLSLMVALIASVIHFVKLIKNTVDYRTNLISIVALIIGGAIIYLVDYNGIASSFDVTSFKFGFLVAIALLVLIRVSLKYSQES